MSASTANDNTTTTATSPNGPQPPPLDANQNNDPGKKTYHKQPTGAALQTAQAHSAPAPLQLYGSCFCPFVQRVWIALELKGLAYRYVEVDVYRKPAELVAINPRGLVPALRHEDGDGKDKGGWGCYESTVVMEYLEDLGEGGPLFPATARGRAHARIWTDHVNRVLVPAFYRLLQAQEEEAQTSLAAELREAIATLVEAADARGPFFLGERMGFVDVQVAPWMVRLRRVLGPYRGWPEPEPGSRWARWVEAVEAEEAVKRSTSDDGLYLDSYQRYAENRPNTSKVREAINSGRGLP